MAKLVEVSGFSPGREVPLNDSLVLGRDPGDAGLVVPNREASRRHAIIRKEGAEYVVEDLGSANGTYVNGIKRQSSSLNEGMLITVGRTTFKFSLGIARGTLSQGSGLPPVRSSKEEKGPTAISPSDEVIAVPEDDDHTISHTPTAEPGGKGSNPLLNRIPGMRELRAVISAAVGGHHAAEADKRGADLSGEGTSSGSGGNAGMGDPVPALSAGIRLPPSHHGRAGPGLQVRSTQAVILGPDEPAGQLIPSSSVGAPGSGLPPVRATGGGTGAEPVLEFRSIEATGRVLSSSAQGSLAGDVDGQSKQKTEGLPAAAGSSTFPAKPLVAQTADVRPRAPVWNLRLDARATQMGVAVGTEPESLKRERDTLHILCEISRTIGSILHLPTLIQEILLKVLELFPAAEGASIHMLDKQGNLLPFGARHRVKGQVEPPVISQTIANMAIADRQSILSTDAAEDSRFFGKQSIILHKVRSFMCSPLLFQDEVHGVLYVDTTDARPRFTGEDLSLFTAVSAQVAVAVKNSHLMADNLHEAEVRLHLTRYLPPDLVEQVIHKQIDLNPGGSLLEGTVLFSDVVGFTPMSERLGPVQLVTTLNRYFEYMVEIIFRYEGSVNRFGGDSIMALWGVPVRRGDDQLKAVCAALEMQRAIFGFNLAAPDDIDPLRVGIGLNTGHFVMGNVGSVQHMEYTALGNHVNLAQRVESQASGSQVFLSENTYGLLRDQLSVFALPPKLLKGVSVPMPIYAVRAVRYQDKTLCAIPALLQWDSGMTAPAVVCQVMESSRLEVWTTRRTEVSSVLLIRFDPPEHPALAVMQAEVCAIEPLTQFVVEGGRMGWKVTLAPAAPLPSLFFPPVVLEPMLGCQYLPRG